MDLISDENQTGDENISAYRIRIHSQAPRSDLACFSPPFWEVRKRGEGSMMGL